MCGYICTNSNPQLFLFAYLMNILQHLDNLRHYDNLLHNLFQYHRHLQQSFFDSMHWEGQLLKPIDYFEHLLDVVDTPDYFLNLVNKHQLLNDLLHL